MWVRCRISIVLQQTSLDCAFRSREYHYFRKFTMNKTKQNQQLQKPLRFSILIRCSVVMYSSINNRQINSKAVLEPIPLDQINTDTIRLRITTKLHNLYSTITHLKKSGEVLSLYSKLQWAYLCADPRIFHRTVAPNSRWRGRHTIITVRKRSCRKVIFLHLSVSHSVHGGEGEHAWKHPEET